MNLKYFKIPVKESFRFTLTGYTTPKWGNKRVVQFTGFINDDFSQEYGLQPLQGIYDHLWDKKVGQTFKIIRLTKGSRHEEAKIKCKLL